MKIVNYREVNCLLCVNWTYKIKLMNHKLEWIWKVVIVNWSVHRTVATLKWDFIHSPLSIPSEQQAGKMIDAGYL